MFLFAIKMENLKTNWKLPGKTKNPRSQQEIGCEEIENTLKTAGFILFFSKKVALSPAIIQNFAGRRGNKSVQPPKNGWTSLQKATWKLVGEIADFRRYNKEKRLWHLFHHSLMCECYEKDTQPLCRLFNKILRNHLNSAISLTNFLASWRSGEFTKSHFSITS